MKCSSCQFENPPHSLFCNKCGDKIPKSDEDLVSTETYVVPMSELKIGSVFAKRYQIIEELGQGGMGRVYKALDMEVNEKIAIKVLKPEISSDKSTIERFRNELRLARKIRHKNVCQMFDLMREKETYFITMEYVSGEDLKSTMSRVGRLSVGKSLLIAKQICRGLAEAHSLGVVHRDLKPHNVMIDRAGDVRVMDFGIARSLRSAGITDSGVMIGTPEYMSPEQALGEDIDQRADIYSLGIILFELLTGKIPFKGDTAVSVALKQKTEAPPDPRRYNTQISQDLKSLILKCLEKDKKKRFQDINELLSEIIVLENRQPTTDRVIPEKRESKESPGKHRLKIYIPAALLVFAVLILAVVFWPRGEEASEFMMTIDADPSDAQVFIDGKLLGNTPIEKKLAPGRYKIRLEREGFKTKEETVNFNADYQKTYLLEKSEPTPFYTIVIPANPAGATIKIDGKTVGTTPETINEWTKMTVHLSIEKQGWSTYSRTMTLKPGVNHIDYSLTRVEVQKTDQEELKPSPSKEKKPVSMPVKAIEEKETFTLTISTEPSGAAIFVNDKEWGASPQQKKLPPDTYLIRIHKPGYQTEEETLALDSTESRHYALIELAPASLSINAYPVAVVTLDNENIGEIPPEKSREVVEGIHHLEFHSKAMDRRFRTSVEVKAGERWELRMSLQTGKFIKINLDSGERIEVMLQPVKKPMESTLSPAG